VLYLHDASRGGDHVRTSTMVSLVKMAEMRVSREYMGRAWGLPVNIQIPSACRLLVTQAEIRHCRVAFVYGVLNVCGHDHRGLDRANGLHAHANVNARHGCENGCDLSRCRGCVNDPRVEFSRARYQ
jgi:hypothetical protein